MTEDSQDEAALWRAALDGDSAAFGLIFDLHKDRVYRHAVRWLRAGPEAEDATAVAFLELWRRRDDVRLVGGSVLPWLLVTTANAVRNQSRAERRYRRFLSALPREPAAAGADEAALNSVRLIDPALRDALARLSPQDAGLLVMISFEDMSVAEVAEALGITAQAVKTRLHRARARVRSLLPDPPLVRGRRRSHAMTATLNDAYSRALRRALVEHVDAARTRRARWRPALFVGAATLAAGTGLAAAAGAFDAPGSPKAQELADTVTLEGVGTRSVDLGAAPAGTTSIELTLTCLTPGTFTGADGSSLNCGPSDAGRATATWRVPASPATTQTIVEAGAGERWRIAATFSAVTTTEWRVNADGLTFGVKNERGTPDLIAVIATNGEPGYVYSRDLDPQPSGLQNSPPAPRRLVLPVYESDGKTNIGEFEAGE